MKTFTIHEAKTNLSKLIEEACQGEEVVIARRPNLVVRLVPIADAKGHRQPGALRGKLCVGPGFFEPVADDELVQ